ncbi:MAG: IS481 family transposase [Hyphomicrobiales bacterium]
MVLAQMVVDSVVLEGRSLRATAQRYGVSKSWVGELVARFRVGGPDALIPKSKAPRSNSRSVSLEVEGLIVATRKELLDVGADAGAETIHWHLTQLGHTVPSVSTLYRVLKRRGFVTPEPRKRPRASYIRFEASLPNECWQSDMTHWQLEDGTGVEIVTFIDDYSRRVLACEVARVTKASEVRAIFSRCCKEFGTPASVLTDNGAIYNAKSRGGRTGFESDLAERGVLYKHSTPYHPQTCGKVERWHKTLKQFLVTRPATTIAELQEILDEKVRYYNEVRPHRSRGRVTPRAAYESRDTMPAHTLFNAPHYRFRHDVVDKRGHVTVRYLGKLRHLNVGWRYRGQSIHLYIVDEHVDIVTPDGELVGEITLDPERDYHPIKRPSSQ